MVNSSAKPVPKLTVQLPGHFNNKKQSILNAGALPMRIQVDNGSEFISKVLVQWAYDNGVTLEDRIQLLPASQLTRRFNSE